MNVHEFAELAAGHALNALSPDDERAFLEALAEHPEWAAIVEADAATAAVLADGAAEVAPPPEAREALLALIARTVPDASASASPSESEGEAVDVAEAPAPGDQGFDALLAPIPWPVADAPPVMEVPVADAESPATAAPPSVAETPAPPSEAESSSEPHEPPPSTEMLQTVQRRNWTGGLLALAASIVLLVALGFGAVFIREQLAPRPPAVVALEQIESAPDAQEVAVEASDGGTVTAHWSESVGQVVVVTAGLPELGDAQTYQAWFVRGETPVPAGVFAPDAAGSATTLLEGGMQADDVIAVTIEPEGGSDLPTSDPIATIPTS